MAAFDLQLVGSTRQARKNSGKWQLRSGRGAEGINCRRCRRLARADATQVMATSAAAASASPRHGLLALFTFRARLFWLRQLLTVVH